MVADEDLSLNCSPERDFVIPRKIARLHANMLKLGAVVLAFAALNVAIAKKKTGSEVITNTVYFGRGPESRTRRAPERGACRCARPRGGVASYLREERTFGRESRVELVEKGCLSLSLALVENIPACLKKTQT